MATDSVFSAGNLGRDGPRFVEVSPLTEAPTSVKLYRSYQPKELNIIVAQSMHMPEMEGRVNVRVPKDIQDQIEKIAAREKTSAGAIVRKILEDYLHYGYEPNMYANRIKRIQLDRDALLAGNASLNRQLIFIANEVIPVVSEIGEHENLVDFLTEIRDIAIRYSHGPESEEAEQVLAEARKNTRVIRGQDYIKVVKNEATGE